MICWRYRTIVFEFKKDGLLGDRFIDDEEVENTLNEQGRAGWELVSATMVQDGLLTLMKQPGAEEVKRKPEREKTDLFRFGGKTVTNKVDDENLLPGMSGDKGAIPAPKRSPEPALKERSNCLVGNIKIN